MKSRRYRQLIKNPIVRLLRPIFRFFYRLFNPRKSKLRTRPDPNLVDDYREPIVEEPAVRKPPTLGEMLDRIDWQFVTVTSSPVSVSSASESSTVRSRPAAVLSTRQGAAIPSSGIEPTANTTRITLARQYSDRTMTVGELFATVQWQQRQAQVDRSAQPPANFDTSRN